MPLLMVCDDADTRHYASHGGCCQKKHVRMFTVTGRRKSMRKERGQQQPAWSYRKDTMIRKLNAEERHTR
jgi:hypothetical protein